MTGWLGLDLLVVWLVRRFLNLVVKTQVQPESRDSLAINPEKPICYVLKTDSIADYLVMDRECKQLGLPAPSKGLTVGRCHLKHGVFFLSRKGWIWERKKLIQTPPTALVLFLDELEQDTKLDVQLVPVSLFWGRAPMRENSVFKILFSDNWRVPGLFGKLLLILIQGRQTVVHFDQPVSLRSVLNEGLAKERTIRKVGRVFRTHFRRLREAIIGPDLSHRRTMLNTLLRQPTVVAAINEEIQQSAKPKPKKVLKKAHSYAEEIAADYSHSVIRLYSLVLTWLWNRLYNGVVITGYDRLTKVVTDNEVIYVPCHRSHIDYLLMSYTLFRRGMVPPHIAAGVNLNMPIVGPILRRGGAFFLRRSFKGNNLYSAVFNEYLNMTFDRGFPVEYFIEGGRSRTGRLLSPRPGMLAMTVRSFLRTRRRNFVFVPVHVSYEKVLEGGTYLGELYGKEKKQESIFDIFRTLRKISKTFGQVYVNFGEPIHLNDMLNKMEPEWRSEKYNDESPPPWTGQVVNALGDEIITRINSAAVVNPVNLISLVLLSTPKHAMDERTLITHLDFCLHFLRAIPYSAVVEIPDMSGSEILEYCEELDFLDRQVHPLGDVIRLTEQKALLMTYYRNNIIHIFSLLSLVACLVLHNRRVARSKLIEQIEHLYSFFKFELFLHWETEEIGGITRQILDILVASHYLKADHQEVWAPDTRAAEFIHLNTLANTTKHSLERFFFTVEILIKAGSGKLQSQQLETACTMLAQRMSLIHELSGPEFSDKALFRSYIQALKANGILEENGEGYLIFGEALLRSYEDTHSLLNADTRQSIQQITEIDLEKDLPEN